MEVTLRFTSEDEEAYMLALNGWKYHSILFGLRQFLRGHDKGWSNEEFDTDLVRQFLIDKCEEHGVPLP
jgi:hypothetical protein